VHPGLRKFGDELTATCVRVFAYMGSLAVLVVVAVNFFGEPAVEAAVEPARSAWTNVERPFRAFALTLPEFAEPEANYAIRRHPAGGLGANGDVPPGQIRSRSPRLLAPLAFRPRTMPFRLLRRQCPAQIVVLGQRRRRIAAVTREQMLKLGQSVTQHLVGLNQLRDLPSHRGDLSILDHDPLIPSSDLLRLLTDEQVMELVKA